MQLNNIDLKDINLKRKEFEYRIKMRIDNDLFKKLYINAKFSPQINSISKNYLNLKALYLKTKGKLPKAIASLYSDVSNDRFEINNKLENIIKKLDKDGYYVQENFISDSEIENLKSELVNQKFSPPGNNINPVSYNELLEYEKLKGNDKYFENIFVTEMNSHPIRKSGSMYKLLANPFFENIANNYLGSKSFINFMKVVVTKAKDPKYFTDRQLHLSANKFHFDYSHLRSIRFFIYLTDVSENAGPHTYIKSSHEENFKYPASENDFYKPGFRKYYNGTSEGLLKEDWVNKNFSTDSQIKFIGKKGTLIIEDTTGFHKGAHCVKGSREILLLNYALSNIGNSDTNRLPVIEDTNNISKNNVNYSFTQRCRKDNEKYLFFGKNISIFRKVKKKLFAKSKNYLI